jgi:hypothetical protein
MMLLDQHLPFLARQLPNALLAHAGCVERHLRARLSIGAAHASALTSPATKLNRRSSAPACGPPTPSRAATVKAGQQTATGGP